METLDYSNSRMASTCFLDTQTNKRTGCKVSQTARQSDFLLYFHVYAYCCMHNN